MLVEAGGVEVLLPEHVVEVHPGVGHDHAGAGPVRAGHRSAVAVGVEHRNVGGRTELVRILRAAGPTVAPHPLAVADPGRDRVKVRRQELPHVFRVVQALVEVLGAPCIRRLRGGDDLLHATPIPEALEQAERVADQDPSRGRRRVGEDQMSPEARTHRLALDRLVGGHVLHAQRPPALTDPVTDRLGRLPSVERLGPIRGEPLEGVRHLRVVKDVPFDQLSALRRVQRRAFRRRDQDRVEDLVEVLRALRQADALAAELDSRLGQPLQRDRPPASPDVLEPRRVAGHTARGRTAVESLGRLVEVDGDRHELGRALHAVGATRPHEEVDQRVLASLVDHHEPARTEPGQIALADERGEDGADGCVDRVSALAQHLCARLGGQRVTRCDDSPLAHARSVSGSAPRTRPSRRCSHSAPAVPREA